MSIVTQLIKSQLFISAVAEKIAGKIEGMQATVNTTDGRTEGTITECTPGDDFKFEIGEGDDLSWQIPFSVTCDATIGYKTSDGEYGTETNSSPVSGYVDVDFPPDALNTVDIEDIVKGCEIQVTVETSDFDSDEDLLDEDIEAPE